MSASTSQYGPGSTITVHVNYARDLYDTELFGAMDPYCLVILGALQYRTVTKKDAGKYPTWDQLFSFRYNNESVIRFVVYDKDTISSDDIVGEAVVSLAAIADKGGDWMGDLQLYRKKNKPAGALNRRTRRSLHRKGDSSSGSGTNISPIQMTPSGGYKPVVQAQPIMAAEAKPILTQQATIVPPQPIVQGHVVIPQQPQPMMMAPPPPQPMGYAPPYQPMMTMNPYQPVYSQQPAGPYAPPAAAPMYSPPPPQQPYYYGGWRGE